MDYGRNNEISLDSIDFTLPGDHLITSRTLSGKPFQGRFDLRIGGSSWTKKPLLGAFYPKETSDKDMLTEYAKRVNYTELNSTFYRGTTPETVKSWYEKTAIRDDFQFLVKAPQKITHIRRFKDVNDEINDFLTTIGLFKEKLAGVFFQGSANLKPKAADEILSSLRAIDSSFTSQVYLELRHKEWFEDDYFKNIVENLSQMNVGLVVSDTQTERDVIHMALTVPKVFIRFNCLGLSYDERRLRDWAKRIADWKSKGLQAAYITLHLPEMEGFAETLSLAKSIFAEAGMETT